MTTLTKGSVPKLDIIERDDEVVVRAEVAGVDKKDLEVSVTDNSVTIRGSTKEEHKEEKGDYFRSEITRGEFSRTAALPCDVDGDKARANFTDGILELVIGSGCGHPFGQNSERDTDHLSLVVEYRPARCS